MSLLSCLYPTQKDNSAVDVDVSLFKSEAVMDSIDKSYSSKEYSSQFELNESNYFLLWTKIFWVCKS